MSARLRTSRSHDDKAPALERVAWYSLLACIALVPLTTSITRGVIGSTHTLTADAFQAPKALVLAIALSVATAAWILDMALNEHRFRVAPVFVPLGLFAALVLASTLLSPQPISALFGASNLMTGGTTWLMCIWAAVLLGQYVTDPRRLKSATWTVLLACGGVALIALLQSARLDPFAMPFKESEIWWVLQGLSTTGNPNVTGLTLILPLSLAVAVALAPGSARLRRGAALLAALVGAALFITLARASWVGGLAALGVLFVLISRMSGKISQATLKKAAAVAAAVLVLGTLFATPEMVARRFTSLEGGLDRFSTGRIALWENATRVIALHPVLGSGPDRLGLEGYKVQKDVVIEDNQRYVPQDPHNVLLLVPALFGIPALLAFLTFVYLVFRLSASQTGPPEGTASYGRVLYAGWVAGLAGVCLASLLSVWSITSVFVFFVAAGVVMGPGLRPARQGTWGILSAIVALSLCAVSVFGSTRNFMASYEVGQSNDPNYRTRLENSLRLAPWDGGLRVNYFWAKMAAYGPILKGADVQAARSAADEIDTEIKLAITEFPDELLFYRLRIDLYSSLKGTAAYDPEREREVIQEVLQTFPDDPEFKDRLEALE